MNGLHTLIITFLFPETKCYYLSTTTQVDKLKLHTQDCGEAREYFLCSNIPNSRNNDTAEGCSGLQYQIPGNEVTKTKAPTTDAELNTYVLGETFQSSIESTLDSTTETIAGSTTKSITKSTIQSMTASTADSTTESANKSTVGSVTESTIGSTSESKIDIITEPSAESPTKALSDSTKDYESPSVTQRTKQTTPEHTVDQVSVNETHAGWKPQKCNMGCHRFCLNRMDVHQYMRKPVRLNPSVPLAQLIKHDFEEGKESFNLIQYPNIYCFFFQLAMRLLHQFSANMEKYIVIFILFVQLQAALLCITTLNVLNFVHVL